MFRQLFLVVLGLFSLAQGYPFYRDRIPNGNNVPHPCTPNVIWDGVGHFVQAGGGARNPFGEAFTVAGGQWTSELCMSDSDNDGVSNGAELGDPECIWQQGDTPTFTANVTHPGICEPVDSEHCRSQPFAFSCEGGAKYECPAVEQPDVKSINLTLPVTEVPAKETNLFCQTFRMPMTQPVHAIAVEPIIDNINVIHHILLFGCTGPTTESGPTECGMTSGTCRVLLVAWTVGIDGLCLLDGVGMAFGPGAYQYVAMQVHWNNPEERTGYTDGSGLRLFYTETLRRYTQQMAILGQRQLIIPALSEETVQTGTCTAACTENFAQPVNITSALVHMHYLGIASRLELYRGGKLAEILIPEAVYDYNAPVMYEFDPPIVMQPGDEIRTHCYYNSLDGTRRRETDTYFGQATNDEMCFSFLSYYPAVPQPFMCVQSGQTAAQCTLSQGGCDTCEQYKLLISSNEYLLTTEACDSGCGEMCREQLSMVMASRCAMDAVESISGGAVVPKELEFIVDVYKACVGPNETRMRALQQPRVHSDLPSFEDCGLDVGGTGYWVTASKTVVFVVTAVAVMMGASL